MHLKMLSRAVGAPIVINDHLLHEATQPGSKPSWSMVQESLKLTQFHTCHPHNHPTPKGTGYMACFVLCTRWRPLYIQSLFNSSQCLGHLSPPNFAQGDLNEM